jgi:hypothetical protein
VVKKCPIFPCFARKRKTLHCSQLLLAVTIVNHCEYKFYRLHKIGFGSLDATMEGVNSRRPVRGSQTMRPVPS